MIAHFITGDRLLYHFEYSLKYAISSRVNTIEESKSYKLVMIRVIRIIEFFFMYIADLKYIK
jgi:hypothetical protein